MRRAGFDAFDMADHYGSAEIVAGRAARILAAEGRPPPLIMTKWCPPPGPMTRDVVRAGVERALERLGLDRVDLMQLHWWRYDHPGYLDAMAELMRLREEGLIGWLGVTNFDAAHLRLLVKHGIEVATNQVCFSLLDRRAAGRMSAVCAELGVRLLAFGTLGGGFLSARWLGAPEPAAIADWSKMKYQRFIDAAGGWSAFPGAARRARPAWRARHGVSIANVADPLGARPRRGRRGDRRRPARRARASGRQSSDAGAPTSTPTTAPRSTPRPPGSAPIPGDCGDEYRRPPFLTASGDLSHHLERRAKVYAAAAGAGPAGARPGRQRLDLGGRGGLQPRGPGRRSHPGQRHHGDRRQRRLRLRGRRRGPDRLHPRQDRGRPGRARRHRSTTSSGPGSTSPTPVAGKGRRAPTPAPSAARCPANTLVAVAGLVGPYLVEIEAEAVATPG